MNEPNPLQPQKRCPMCGGTAHIVVPEGSVAPTYVACCGVCGLRTVGFRAPGLATAAWDNRGPQSPEAFVRNAMRRLDPTGAVAKIAEILGIKLTKRDKSYVRM